MLYQSKQLVFDISRAVSAVAYESTNFEQILTTIKSYVDYQIKDLDYPTDPSLDISASYYPHGLYPYGLDPNRIPVGAVFAQVDANYPNLKSDAYQFIREYFSPNCYLSSTITKNHYNIIIRRE